MQKKYDLIVVGSGVNGMVCALLGAQYGLDVLLLEGHESLGGGVRTKALTGEGFLHDVCSAVHPFGRCSPVLRSLSLETEGLEWVDPAAPVAHPLLDDDAILLYRDVDKTAQELGRGGRIYSKLMKSLLRDWEILEEQLLAPALRTPALHTLRALARFGPAAAMPASWLGPLLGKRGAALWAGLAGHSLLQMEALSSSAVACVLGLLAHKVGWPMPRGGAVSIARSLERKLRNNGVEIQLNTWVREVSELPSARAVVLDLSAKQVHSLLGPLLPPGRRRALERYKLGPGIFKLDYALSGPVPWSDSRVAKAGTVHVGGYLPEIALSERDVWAGKMSRHPFLLAVQPSLFDATRAPVGCHTFWVYCHTPNGWNGDATQLIEDQLERYAPGFRDLILQRHTMSASDFQEYNPNYVGGDILGGANTLYQVAARPFFSKDPYHLGGRYYCCSASVPPGGGVHGMGGYHAFQSVLNQF